jgi:putative Holliday junction resolvase
MDRLVGIDFGRKRIGVAVSDPLGIFASALETVQSAKIIDYLKKYSENEHITRFVVGYPKNMDNTPSEAAADVEVFLKVLAKAFPQVPVSLEDERFTSVLAHRAMIDGGMKAKDRRDKSSVDKISAAIILQSYIDSSQMSSRQPGEGTNFAAVPTAVPESRSMKVTGKRKKH